MTPNAQPIVCEILSQKLEQKEYRVDVLLSLPAEMTAGYSRYLITEIAYGAGRTQSLTSDLEGPRTVNAEFYQEIGSTAQWINTTTSITVSGNYILTADLDFSASQSSADWYVYRFTGKLDGGIYETTTQELTDFTGAVISDADGQPRTMEVRGALEGMHTISGVGNCIKADDGTWTPLKGRDSTYRSCLMLYLTGTMENLIFRDFYNSADSNLTATANSIYSGVIGCAQSGARVENCHVRNSRFLGRAYLGALIASASSTDLRGCSVRGVELSAYRLNDTYTDSVRVGGLVGAADGSTAENCFAAEVDLEVLNAYDCAGAGGLMGYVYNSVIQDCYTTGVLETNSTYAGGIMGYMGGDGSLTGCWSTVAVSTVSDYAGGILGCHAGGVLKNNYTSSTLMTRSMSTSAFHRITSTTAFDQNIRFNNYAFSGQRLTYFNPNAAAQDASAYDFGVWDQLDGATALLDEAALSQSTTWSGIIGVGSGYDLTGTARADVGGSHVTSVAEGLLPKLTDSSGTLLYDQPDVEIGGTSASYLSVLQSNQVSTQECFEVTLALYSDRDDLLDAQFADLADWDNLTILGGAIDKTSGFTDRGRKTLPDGRVGRAFQCKIYYGSSAGTGGHYLDKYLVSLPLRDQNGAVSEVLQTYVATSTPVYKILYTIDDWDNFFSDPNYAGSYENVQIGWSSTNNGIIDFGKETAYSTATGRHALNVRVNRLDGAPSTAVAGETASYPVLCNLTDGFITVRQADPFVLAKMDARLIVQVIINIVDNAIKYTPPGSNISIATYPRETSIVTEIADDGPGIPDQAKPRIFDMFYTAETKIADSRRSLGLGLALCKTIITAHGGTISVLDNSPQGTIFQFTLPIEEVTLHE